MWVRGGIPFSIVVQKPRLTGKPPFYDATFSNTSSEVCCGEGWEHGEQSTLTMNVLHPEVTHITYTHISMSKARHMARPNFKGWELVEKGELKIPVNTSDVHHNEWKHVNEWMNKLMSEWMNSGNKNEDGPCKQWLGSQFVKQLSRCCMGPTLSSIQIWLGRRMPVTMF